MPFGQFENITFYINLLCLLFLATFVNILECYTFLHLVTLQSLPIWVFERVGSISRRCGVISGWVQHTEARKLFRESNFWISLKSLKAFEVKKYSLRWKMRWEWCSKYFWSKKKSRSMTFKRLTFYQMALLQVTFQYLTFCTNVISFRYVWTQFMFVESIWKL